MHIFSYNGMSIRRVYGGKGKGEASTQAEYGGWIHHDGCNVSCQNDGVRPVLHLNLAFSDVYSYAGTVCSDGTEEVELQQ